MPFPGTLISLLVLLIIAGLVLWIIGQIPMDATIARIIRVVVIVVICIYLLYFLLGMLPPAYYPYRR